MLRIIFWVVVGLLALSFFGISLQELVQNPQTQANFRFLFGLIENGWRVLTGWISALGAPFRGGN